MAVLDSESFAASSAGADFILYGLLSGSTPTIGSGGALGDNYCRLTSASSAIATNKLMKAPAGTWFFGARMRVSAAGGTGTNFAGLAFYDTLGNVQFTVVLSISTGAISVYQGYGQGGTLLGTSAAGAFIFTSWFYLEVGATISTSTGTVTVRVNNVAVLTLTGVNNRGATAGATTQMASLLVGAGWTFGATIDWMHLYWADNTGAAPWNTFLGDVRVQGVFPNANSAVQFTPTGLANNWQNAAKYPPVPGTDYNADSTVGHTDLFTTAGIATSLTSVLAVKVSMLALKSDAGSRTMATVLKSGSTTQVGATQSPGTSAQYFSDVYQLDPNTAAQWTLTAVNAALPGYKIVS